MDVVGTNVAIPATLCETEFRRRALAVPIEPVRQAALARVGIELWIRRDDLIDEHLTGNKFYKLFYNLVAARAQGYHRVVSFGGAYSNHLHALAAAGHRYGFDTVGIVRGERPALLSPTLQDAQDWGMRLVFVTRDQYRTLQAPTTLVPRCELAQPQWLLQLKDDIGAAHWIPEGGANSWGALGMQVMGESIRQQMPGQYSAACIACGTGTSLAGLAAGIAPETANIGPQTLALGFSVLKGDGGLGAVVADTFKQSAGAGLLACQGAGQARAATSLKPERAANWRLISGFHAGGYAKKHPDYLRRFWQDFEQETGIALDPVYTLKLFWGIHALAQQGYWPKGTRLVAIHTGGLQGRRGFGAI